MTLLEDGLMSERELENERATEEYVRSLLDEIGRLRAVLETVRTDIQQRLAGDSRLDAPFDEDLGDAENRITRALDRPQQGK